MANYLITKGIVRDQKEAFEKYLVKCNVPKYPLPRRGVESAEKHCRNNKTLGELCRKRTFLVHALLLKTVM